jgi:hypothetical protein
MYTAYKKIGETKKKAIAMPTICNLRLKDREEGIKALTKVLYELCRKSAPTPPERERAQRVALQLRVLREHPDG